MFELLMNQELVFGLFGGLGLFLFGMKTMSEGLQKVAGGKIRQILSALTNNRFMGALVGLAVTAMIQSSSATTVMVVGFVNAGLMSLIQAIGVVLGANIGTTVTAQLLAFKITEFALPVIGVGAGFKLFSRSKKWSYWGEIILGFGILFFGLSIMKQAFDPVRGSLEFQQLFLQVGDNHLLGVLIGAMITVIVQSSTATMAITIALATSGLLTFEAGIALILGENIGTTITANLAAIGTNLAARRAALAHFLFNVLGVAYMLVLFPSFTSMVTSLTEYFVGGTADFVIATQEQMLLYGGDIGDKPFIARHIANTHTLFNIVNTIIFLPLIGALAKLTTVVMPGKDVEGDFHLKFIDNRVLNTPPIALGQARAETRRMAHIALNCLNQTILFLNDFDSRRVPELSKNEEHLDLLQKEIMDFLVALSQKSISQESSREISALMHMVNDLERVGDHCENLWKLEERKLDQRISFSSIAMAELNEIASTTRKFLELIVQRMEQREIDGFSETALAMEEQIDQLESDLRNNHITRLNTGECAVLPGLIFIDMLHNFEKIGDHIFKISQASDRK